MPARTNASRDTESTLQISVAKPNNTAAKQISVSLLYDRAIEELLTAASLLRYCANRRHDIIPASSNMPSSSSTLATAQT